MIKKKEYFDYQKISEAIDTYIQAHLDNDSFGGSILVAHKDEIILSRGYGMANIEHQIPNTPQTKFRLGSITKQFTATAILQLQEQGLLDVNKSVATYLPKYPNGKRITVHNLLNHTAGIPNYTGLPIFTKNKRLETSLDDLIAWFKNKPLKFRNLNPNEEITAKKYLLVQIQNLVDNLLRRKPPGDNFNYSNSGYVVLTKIIETLSKQSYEDYLQQYIFQPLGMTNSGYDHSETILLNRASGYISGREGYQNADFIDMSTPSGAGGLYSTVEDLLKWSRSLDTEQVLNKSSKDAMFAPKVKMNLEPDKDSYYGYGWEIDTCCNKQRISHRGGIDGFATAIDRYPEEGVTIIVLSNFINSAIGKTRDDLNHIFWGESYELPQKREIISVTPEDLTAYVGCYQFKSPIPLPFIPKPTLTVTTESQRIFVQAKDQKPIEIFPESRHQFFLKIIEAKITFVADEDNIISKIVIDINGKEQVATKIKK